MTTKDQINVLRLDVESLRERLGEKLKQIAELENACEHVWTEPKLGVLKSQTIFHARKWERECTKCGKVDITYREAMQAVPDFGDQNGKITIPNFGG